MLISAKVKIGDKIVLVVTTLVAGVMVFPIAYEWYWTMRRHHVSSQIKASYMWSAARGEVTVPSTNSDSIRCWSSCFWSLPRMVRVKDSSGNTFSYIAHHTTNSGTPYSFKFIARENAKGNSLTNAPSL